MIPTITWTSSGIRIIDQTRLPAEEVYLDLTRLDQVCEAIGSLRIRGAPALGVAGAMGVAQAAQHARERGEDLDTAVRDAAASLRATRPTAVNLGWALDRMLRVWETTTAGDGAGRAARLVDEAQAIQTEDLAMSAAMERAGADLVPRGGRILTHCNTGGLATGGLGTALAAVFEAHRRGLGPEVFADETRPLLQGARLTAWELERVGIPVTVLVDGAAGWLMRRRGVDLVLFGADRVAQNGDTANKIGSYMLALAAQRHAIPVYVAAPTSSFDPGLPDGEAIPIEERHPDEVRRWGGRQTAPPDVPVFNPAFDVTPAELIRGWITEGGVLKPPFTAGALAAARAQPGRPV
ncbi:MAG: S-methyl-5-thioribose-1-phosphate isomerase [Candidatus Eisenbacteria bacterium]|nr:S-methyl-5-thioribose-1-phosphate isomerase [Candidatus Eisenbacteria bacterium]